MRSTRNAALLALGLLSLLYPGCARRSLKPAESPASAGWVKPTWGPEAGGLQCRLRPTKRLWPADEPAVFKLDLRNQGKRVFAFVSSERVPLHRVSLDGRWYRWPSSPVTEGKMWPLAPDVEFPSLSVSLPGPMDLTLTPGRHVIQVTFLFEGVEVVSNPVAIEVLPTP